MMFECKVEGRGKGRWRKKGRTKGRREKEGKGLKKGGKTRRRGVIKINENKVRGNRGKRSERRESKRKK